jgi:alkylation response protein AidB-like acyl-CoA dehydrogenase
VNILNYEEEHQQFRFRLRSFLDKEVKPYVDQWEKDHLVPRSIWKEMGKEGFLCPYVSAEYGGMNGDFRYAVIIADEMSKTNHMGLALNLHNDVVVPYIETFGTEEQKRKYLPGCISGDIVTAVAMTEPDAGSDLSNLQTTAREEGDEIIIEGSKTFISNGINSDLVILAARDPKAENSHKAISLYLIESDTHGFKRGNRLDKMGWHSQDTAELFFSNCRIHKTNRLGPKGAGFYMLMEKLQQERLSVVLMAVFAAERIIEWTADYFSRANKKKNSVSNTQAVQFALVEMMTEVKLGRTFMEKLVADHIEGKKIVIETSMAKYWTTEMVNRVVDRCIGLLGDEGMLERCPIIRTRRDVRVMTIFAGTNEVMKGIAAKFMGL